MLADSDLNIHPVGSKAPVSGHHPWGAGWNLLPDYLLLPKAPQAQAPLLFVRPQCGLASGTPGLGQPQSLLGPGCAASLASAARGEDAFPLPSGAASPFPAQ